MSARPFRQVKASAGSGKTYALTRHFLDLLGRAQSPEGGSSFACAGAAQRPQGFTWPEILAVTFTNKAAAEMQARVLEALKAIALSPADASGSEGGAIPCGLSRERAERLLTDILRHASKLGIRTIDSLLNMLMRQFALDQGIRPDFDIEFNERRALDELFQAFLAVCAEGGSQGAEAAALYDQAVRTLIEHEDKDGFWLQDALRQRMLELTSLIARCALDGTRFTTDQGRMADLLTPPYARMRQAAEVMLNALEAEDLSPAKNFTTLLARCQEAELFAGLPDSAYLRKASLDECLNKAGKGRATAQARGAFDEFTAASAEYVLAQAILEPAYALAPCVEIGQRLADALPGHQRGRGYLFGSQLAGKVVSALEEGDGVPDAFCRLGERLHHLLVDEFQDTSADQWRAMLPLALECLAKGGSLFYVGDVKQAIYAWRGGDARLFDQVGRDEELTAVSGGLDACTLPDNWRSAPAVIAFNNEIFGRLEGPETPADLAQALLADAPEHIREDLAGALQAAFRGCAQGFPEGKEAGVPGHVHLRLLPPAPKREVEAMSLDALADTVASVRRRRPLGDMAVLVRTNTHADLVCERLVREGVPIITENSLLLSRHPLVRQLVALLRVLDSPSDDVAFLEFAGGSELFLPESGLAAADILDWLSGLGQGRRHGLLQRFREDFPQVFDRLVGPFLRQSGLMRPYDLLRAALDTFQVQARHPGAELYVRRLLEVVHLAEEQGAGSVARFLEFWDDAGAEEKVPLPEASDAVRILTIHKAKGLQFPVTIVPFHNWPGDRIKEYRPVEHCGHTLLTRLTKGLGEPWHRRMAEAVAEQVNLLYVAWTRAEEELYLVAPSVGGKRTLGLVPVILEHLLTPPAEAAELSWGQAPPCAEADCATDEPGASPLPDIPPLDAAPEFLAWLPRLRVYRHTMPDQGDDAGATGAVDERTRGKLAHKAVELLRPTGADGADAERAATLALHEFPELRAVAEATRTRLRDEVAAMLRWLLAQAELRPALEGAASPAGPGGGELTILAPDGAFLRPDLLHLSPEGATVLEFKTGAADPDHARQLRAYLELAQGLGELAPGAPIRGFLVYLDRRVVEPLGLERGGA